MSLSLVRLRCLLIPLCVVIVAAVTTQLNAVDVFGGDSAKATDANGQLLVRTDGEIDGIGSFTLYRATDGKLYALSAGHCVESNTNSMYIGIWQEKVIVLVPVCYDTNLDYAVFSVSDQTLTPPTFKFSSPSTNDNRQVQTVGAHYKRWCKVIVNGLYYLTLDDGDLAYDMPGVSKGYSGAGVFNEAGDCVGIVVRHGEETGYTAIVPAPIILNAIRNTNHKELLPHE
jgi:hypothetical protein